MDLQGLLETTLNGLGYELVLRPKGTVVFEELSATFKDDE